MCTESVQVLEGMYDILILKYLTYLSSSTCTHPMHIVVIIIESVSVVGKTK